MSEIIYAEDLPYWKTSQGDIDNWIDKAKEEIRRAGGKITSEAFASKNGQEGFLLEFSIAGDSFAIRWPVLPTRKVNDVEKRAAKRQAVTMLYHDVKSRCVSARVMGARSAFMGYLVLPNGQTADQINNNEFLALIPPVLMLPSGEGKS